LLIGGGEVVGSNPTISPTINHYFRSVFAFCVLHFAFD